MQTSKVSLELAGLRSRIMLDYVSGSQFLESFYRWKPEMATFNEVIEERKKYPVNRMVLVNQLTEQNRRYFTDFPEAEKNIQSLLKENTFTVTTGHQLCLATGPLYFIYKIISTIRLSQELNKHFPENHFVPVYWMASEDHDIDEINHFYLNNDKLVWSTQQQGAAGKLSLNGINDLFNQLQPDILSTELFRIFSTAYSEEQNLADAMRSITMHLFGNDGLVVMNADDHELKKLFAPVMKRELLEKDSFRLVNESSEKLKEVLDPQVSPREINLFWLGQHARDRIVQNINGSYEVLNQNIHFTREDILRELENNPECFSPNVVMRPMYQESILPNICYVGGPGEIAYWLQYKKNFEEHKIFYPLLVLRNHAVILPEKVAVKWESLGFEKDQLFSNTEDLIKKYVALHESKSMSMDVYILELESVYNKLAAALKETDPTLEGAVKAEYQRALNGMEQLGKKQQASLKKKYETGVNQIKTITEKVKPGNIPQERYQNILQYAGQANAIITELMQQFQPFEMYVNIIWI